MTSKTAIKILQHNINGFNSKSISLNNTLTHNCIDICLFQELYKINNNENRNRPNFKLTGYNTYLSPSGRCGIAIIDSIQSQKLPNVSTPLSFSHFGFEALYVQVSWPRNPPIIFCSFYMTPSATNYDHIAHHFKQEIDKIKNITTNYIICGDFNAKHPIWGCDTQDDIGIKYIDIFNHFSLQIHNDGSPTRIDPQYYTSQYIDLTLSSPSLSSLVDLWSIDKYIVSNSDHLPITFHLNVHHIKPQKIASHITWDFRSFDHIQFKQTLTAHLNEWWNQRHQFPTINEAYLSWANAFRAACYKSVGTKKVSHTSKSWWNDRLTFLRTKTNALRRRHQKYRDQKSYEQWKSSQKEYNHEIKDAKSKDWNHFCDALNHCTIKQLFGRYNKLYKTKIKQIPALLDPETNYTITNTTAKAELLNRNFSYQSTNHSDPIFEKTVNDFLHIYNNTHHPQEHNVHDTQEFINNDITLHEVSKAIKSIESWKAMGCDHIHNYLLKSGGPVVAKTLHYLFQLSWDSNQLPWIWKLSEICPIPKPNKNHSNPTNYRPISLLSTVGKLMEKIVASRLTWYLDEYNLLTQHQAGFRPHHNTDELLLRLTQDIWTTIDETDPLYTVFLDISKAFDSVWRNGLEYKLIHEFHLNGRIYLWIHDFLKNRFSRTIINDNKSSWKLFSRGVPQGSCLSPILYIIYMNSLPKSIKFLFKLVFLLMMSLFGVQIIHIFNYHSIKLFFGSINGIYT